MSSHTTTSLNITPSSITSSSITSLNVAPSDTMSPKMNLVSLPYEVRAQIFQQYFKVDGGYVYHGESEKLVTADGQPIDFSLMYTCHSIADDTRKMPLAVNTITFSTVYRRDWREQAGGLHAMLCLGFQLREILVTRFARDRRVTPDIISQLARKFPQHVQSIKDIVQGEVRYAHLGGYGLRGGGKGLLSNWLYLDRPDQYPGVLSRTVRTLICWDRAGGRASFFDAIDYTLRLLAEKYPAEFASLINEAHPGWTDSHSPDEFLDLTFDPWAIPSLSEVVTVGDPLGANSLWECLEEWYYDPSHEGTGDRYREKLYFSAAAVAIRFLSRLPAHHRLCIQNVTLNEDRVAMGHPQCHARGLIPFCKENPRLRVERRVNLWRNILLKKHMPYPRDVWKLVKGRAFEDSALYQPNENDILSYDIDDELLPWLADALEVMDEGMPVGSFSFVLDGDPDLDLSSDLFDKVIHRQVAWKRSLSECIARGLFSHDISRSECLGNAFRIVDDHFVEAIDALMSGTSILRSNFNLSQPWDYEGLIVEHQHPDRIDWMSIVEAVEPERFPFPAPAGPVKLRIEMFERQRQCDYLDSSLRISKREKKRLRRVRRRRAATLAAENAARGAGLSLGSDSDSDSDPDLDIMEATMRLLFGEVS